MTLGLISDLGEDPIGLFDEVAIDGVDVKCASDLSEYSPSLFDILVWKWFGERRCVNGKESCVCMLGKGMFRINKNSVKIL